MTIIGYSSSSGEQPKNMPRNINLLILNGMQTYLNISKRKNDGMITVFLKIV